MTATLANDSHPQQLLTAMEAAQVLGIGRTLAYRLVRDGAWPTPVIRTGRLITIPADPYSATSRRASRPDPNSAVASLEMH